MWYLHGLGLICLPWRPTVHHLGPFVMSLIHHYQWHICQSTFPSPNSHRGLTLQNFESFLRLFKQSWKTFDTFICFSCLQCPMFRREGDSEVAEPFAMEAKYFTESRLLQRDVKIILEGVSNQNFLGSVIHPVGVWPLTSPSPVPVLIDSTKCWH